MVKTDKRDALALANHLYNQLEKGIQVVDKLQLIRRAVAASPSAALLRALMRHRYELIQETTRRKNKLTAIYDEVFPEFTQIFKDPNLPSALAFRQQFPTPQAVSTASLDALSKVRVGRYGATAKLVELQTLAAQSIGTKDIARQRGLVIEQAQLIKELQLMQDHIAELDREISATVEQSREGQILTSILDLLTRRLTLLGRYFPTSVLLKYGFRKPRATNGTIDGDCGLAHPEIPLAYLP
jgi:hypothetical protein